MTTQRPAAYSTLAQMETSQPCRHNLETLTLDHNRSDCRIGRTRHPALGWMKLLCTSRTKPGLQQTPIERAQEPGVPKDATRKRDVTGPPQTCSANAQPLTAPLRGFVLVELPLPFPSAENTELAVLHSSLVGPMPGRSHAGRASCEPGKAQIFNASTASTVISVPMFRPRDKKVSMNSS